MATATASGGTLSPPSSPQRRPHRKHQDSFLVFEHASIDVKSSSEDLRKASIAEQEPEHDEPLWRKAILMPLLSVSFILSLFLVEREGRARRSSEHPVSGEAGEQSFWSTFSLQNWLDPEPYQDAADSTWQDAKDGNGSVPKQQQGRKSWFVRKKHRKMAKANLEEAFEKRGTVMVLLLVLGCVFIVGFGWAGTKVYHGLVGRIL